MNWSVFMGRIHGNNFINKNVPPKNIKTTKILKARFWLFLYVLLELICSLGGRISFFFISPLCRILQVSAQVPDRKNPIVINIVPKARKSTKFLIFGAKISVEFSGALGLYFILILSPSSIALLLL